MGRMSRSSVMLKKEIKMSFLKDVFQTADEIKQSQDKLKDAVDASSRQAAALIRPYLSEVQNEILSEILERLVAPLLRPYLSERISVGLNAEKSFTAFGVSYLPFGVLTDAKNRTLWMGNSLQINEKLIEQSTR